MAGQKSWLTKLFGGAREPACVPDGVCVYAVGDIHGRHDLMTALLDKIWADSSDSLKNVLVFVGDYVDRGPASAQVVEHLVHLQRPGWDIIKLLGNHEYSLLEFLKKPEIYGSWKTYGGAETLLSYGVKPPLFSDPKELHRAHAEFVAKFPREHFTFLSGLPYSHQIGDYMFVHAGVRPGRSLEDQSPEDLLWIRDDFLYCDQGFGKTIVHGHTPSEEPVIRFNRIGIDTGAYATNRLTAVKLINQLREFLSSDMQ